MHKHYPLDRQSFL